MQAAVVAPVEPENLAATSLHQKMQVVPIPTEPALDELKEDTRVAEAGHAAGLRRGSTTPDAEDTWLKVGLAVVGVLIVLLVVGVCAGVTSTLLEQPEELGEFEE